MKYKLIFLIIINALTCFPQNKNNNITYSYGAIVRGDSTKKELALVFTGDSYADGAKDIIKTLSRENIKASFFFTGNFYRNKNFEDDINALLADNHYLGAHSDKHLLYCDWDKRDSTLITHEEFVVDIFNNYNEMKKIGINIEESKYYLPPYEWYNDTISKWTKEVGLTLINFTSGTRSNADYTTPEMKNYISSEEIHNSILNYESSHQNGLNGFILLIHFGTASERKDKYYFYLNDLVNELRRRGYSFKRVDELLDTSEK